MFRVIERACGAEDKAHDGAGVMECLIRHKMDHLEKGQGAMKKKCRTVVEHWQIIPKCNLIQGVFFYWSALKTTKCKPLKEFSELVLPQND